MENNQKKILIIGGSLVVGGVQVFVMGFLKNLDTSKWKVDYLSYHEGGHKEYIEEIEKRGGKVFYAPPKSRGMFKSLYRVYQIVKMGKYDIVWKHTESLFRALDLYAAYFAGTRRLILHSHRTETPKVEKILGIFLSPFLNRIVTDRFACGELAGRNLHGRHPFRIIPNGIQSNNYVYNLQTRDRLRETKHLEKDAFVVGHVGRMSYSKNHVFLLNVFAQIQNIKEAYLLIVGDGPLKNEIESQIKNLGLQKKVIMVGNQENVCEWLMAMDIMIFPSHYEGLPISVIEAQATGLPCLLSDVIDHQVVISDVVYFETLQKNASEWAEKAIEMYNICKGKKREKYVQCVIDNGYDALQNTQMLEEILDSAGEE